MSNVDSYLAIALFSATFTLFNWRYAQILLQFFTTKSKKTDSLEHGELKPPLPIEVVNLLSMSKLCFLATVNKAEPHLSLMNFTYYQPDEVIILCTRKNTKKYVQIQNCPNVSILIHDFPHLANDNSTAFTKQWSITLNGLAKCLLNDDEVSKRYRRIHLQNNPEYKQFILDDNDDISVVVVNIDTARICDIMDKVQIWNAPRKL